MNGYVFIALLAILLATTCYQPNNAMRPAGSLTFQHAIAKNGVNHAEGLCQAEVNCTACHGADLKGGSNGQPSCYNCHGAKWQACGTPHTLLKNGVKHAAGLCQPEANCASCHGADLRGGSAGQPSCYQCHGSKWQTCGTPHNQIKGGVGHADNYCLPYQNCNGCHGTNLRGGSSGQPSCLRCHDQKKWKNCGSVQHNISKEGNLHAQGYKTPMTLCNLCHGSDLRGGFNNEPSCYKCHGKEW